MRDSNPLKSSVSPFYSRKKTMGLYPVDKSKDFIDEGMTLITETDSEKHLKAYKKMKKKEELYPLPEDRYERPCGGAGGFDDFVERWHE
jgi:hypothetical protein